MKTSGSDQHARVSLAQVKDRDENDEQSIRKGVEEVLAPLGGLGNYVSTGDRVLLKPNQEIFRDSLSGSTTSPQLVRVLAGMCFELGAREVWVGDGAGHGQMSRYIMAMTGMTQELKGTGAHMIYFDEIAETVIDFGNDAGDLRYMPVPEIMERADVVINVPKAKTHVVDPISCACMNWTGVMPMNFRLTLQRVTDQYYRGADLDALVIRYDQSRGRAIDRSIFEPFDVRGRAVLIDTGWDRHWRTDHYFEGHPFVTRAAARFLADSGAVLVGIDSLNIDDTDDLTRPAHSILLGAGIPIAEHLCNLSALPDSGFRFFAVPVKVRNFGTFPVRAFGMVR